MKFSKSLFLAFAGLGLFACSNEDVAENGGIEGDANVAVGINLSNLTGDIAKRSVDAGDETPTGSGTAPVELKEVKLTLESLTAEPQVYTFKSEELTDPTSLTHTFNKVRNPNKISVSINGGKDVSLNPVEGELHLKDFYNVGLAAPLYAGTTDFGEAKKVNGVLTYEVTLAPEHKISLLEFSGIKHEEHESEDCLFEKLHFDGMFLNSVMLHEKTFGEGEYNSWAEAISDPNAPTWSKIDKSFLKSNGVTPIFPAEDGKCYAYNIFPEIGEENMPKLTLCFSDIELNWKSTIAGWEEGKPLYVAVSRYKLNLSGEDKTISEEDRDKYGVDEKGYLKAFKPGYVYKFKDLVVPDEAFGPTPEGGEDAQVIANVEILPWNVVEGTVEW